MKYGVSSFYVDNLLKVLSRFPPTLCYYPLVAIGHRFRDWNHYAASGAEVGVLYRGMETVQHFLGLGSDESRALIKNLLRFESRYLLENYWMIRRDNKKIKGAFTRQTRENFPGVVNGRQYVVVIIHNANLFLFSALSRLLGLDICSMVGELPGVLPASENPVQRHGLRMIYYWKEWQFLIPPSARSAVEVIRNGHSLFVAVDLPGYNNRGVKVNFLGSDIWVASGAVKLANKFDLPMLVAVPWAGAVTRKYSAFFEKIMPTGDISRDMNNVFKCLEKVVLLNPECWLGWLCLHQMIAK